MSRLVTYLLLALWWATPLSSVRAADSLTLFEQRVRPVLAEKCYECHAARTGKAEGGLQLDSSVGIRRGGDGGPIVVAERVQASRLLAALRYEDLEMPPTGQLPDTVVADFERWIEQGAALPIDESSVATHQTSEDAWRDHWAFQPVRRPRLPVVSDTNWCRSPIDRFVLSRLELEGLTPSCAR